MIRRARPSSTHRPAARRGAVIAVVTALATFAALLLGVPQQADAAVNHPVVGRITILKQAGNGFDVQGWAYEPDRAAAVAVRVRVDGRTVGTPLARLWSPNLVKVHPGWGDHRRFKLDVNEPAGRHTVCADAVDYPSRRARVSFGCRTITLNYDPFGSVDTMVFTPGHFAITGWTLDPNDETKSLGIGVRVDNVVVTSTIANQQRGDIASRYPGAGAAHGFAASFAVPEGQHTICVRAQNIGLGSASSVPILCTTRTVNDSPLGEIQQVVQEPNGQVRVVGQAWDPDTSARIPVQILSDGVLLGSAVTSGTPAHPLHGFDLTYAVPPSQFTPGARNICVVGVNAGAYGHDRTVACSSTTLNYNPVQAIQTTTQGSGGVKVTGWAVDPDTTTPINVVLTVDGRSPSTVAASGANKAHAGHGFSALLPAGNGSHKVCATGVNVLAGAGPVTPACTQVTLNFNPIGSFAPVTRADPSGPITVTGWASDPDTTAPISVRVTIDNGQPQTLVANGTGTTGPSAHHAFAATLPTTDGEHTVCVTAVNVAAGSGDTPLGCNLIIAVHPVAPATPTNVVATAGYGGAVVTWTPPASDGGAPWTKYTVTASPGGITATAGPTDTSATVYGLKPSTAYTFTVSATNVAGTSLPTVSNSATTQAQPPAQTTPAPISTSRYVRNISSANSSDTAKMYAEGQADANANPSGHGYLILLDIGGQDESRGGVILSASIKFVTYSALVANVKSYLDGYASKQRASAPVTVAVGTNNDVDVSATSGKHWADLVVDPLVTYARKYPGITVTGANDIEPGFTAGYAASKAWLTGYLGANTAPFVFNGSADGCSGYGTGSGCNNGWSAAGLYYLAGGAAPTRIINLPQIYNTTMARQWRYISLTGVLQGHPRINFGGALTEWTACQQAGGCGSLTGNSAWTEMWNQLRAEPALKITSLPYSTDLRIDW
ncbi:MAG: fibronectin type III domain-containing protein [Jatrophihabitans sp.]|uniref:fibronectin type III domain-containing protein n=1 Tax=Jatrophihabitans sp. TaxID=1932789 RepID=UPI003F804BED